MISCLLFRVLTGDSNIHLCGRIAMALMLIFTSTAHFVFTKGMALMIPPFVPLKKILVYVTGLLEIMAAVGLLVPATRYNTGLCLLLFFAILLPANVYAAQKKIDLEKANFNGNGLSYLWFRVPLQLLFIFWTWYFAIYH